MFALCRIGFCFVRETSPGNLNYHNTGLAQTVASVENFNLVSGINNLKYMWSSSSLDRKMNYPCATSTPMKGTFFTIKRHINSKKNCREHHMSSCCNSWRIALGSRNEGPHFLVVRFSASITVSVSVSIKIVLFL